MVGFARGLGLVVMLLGLASCAGAAIHSPEASETVKPAPAEVRSLKVWVATVVLTGPGAEDARKAMPGTEDLWRRELRGALVDAGLAVVEKEADAPDVHAQLVVDYTFIVNFGSNDIKREIALTFLRGGVAVDVARVSAMSHAGSGYDPSLVVRGLSAAITNRATGSTRLADLARELHPASASEQGSTAAASSTPARPGAPAGVAGPKEPRTALVVGNGAYTEGRLANPVNDAKLVAQALTGVGFTVTTLFDADQPAMKRAIDQFGSRLEAGGVGLFYFSGHGVQVEGRNYVIPIGANIKRESDVDIEAVDMARVLARMDGADNRLNIVVLDACRNNPFARSFRSASRGLAFVDAPEGTLIAYATAPGDVAEDGAGANSTFSFSLAKNMATPHAKVEDVFKAVRRDVKAATGGRQTSWEASSLESDFFFVRP